MIGWRKIRKEDVELGVVVRFTGMTDTPFTGAVIIATMKHPDNIIVRMARPMAFASDCHLSGPYLYAEIFEATVRRLCEDSGVEVYENRDGQLRKSKR